MVVWTKALKPHPGMLTVARAFLLGALFETASFLAYLKPDLEPWCMLLLGAVAASLALRDLRLLFGLLVIETVMGSHGRMFDTVLFGFPLSIRMVLFGILVVAWTIHVMRGCSRLLHFPHARVTGPLLLLLVAGALGFMRGWARGTPLGEVFSDANGYAFLLLIPIGLDLLADRASFAWIARVFVGALLWLSAKTLLTLFLFSHDVPYVLLDVFRWQRVSGLSEITRLGAGAVRVFAASHVFLLIGAFTGALVGWKTGSRRLLFWTAAVFAALVVGMSRSLWLGLAVSAAFLLPVLVRKGVVGRGGITALLGRSALALLLGVALAALTALFPWPRPEIGAAAFGMYGGRLVESDAAVSSRWNLLGPLQARIAEAPIVGSGFGAAVTYQSDDPRIHALYPGGRITTPAIEWQYLEIWLKMGLLGLLAVVWLWWRVGLMAWRALQDARGADTALAAGLFGAFLAFVLANVFTPYVNHPLGWMFLTFVLCGFHAVEEHAPPEHGHRPSPISR